MTDGVHQFDTAGEYFTAIDLWGARFDQHPADVDPDRLARLVAMLPPRWREAWELRAGGLVQKDIAERLGMHRENVGKILRRARNALKLLLSLPDISEDSIQADLAPHLKPRPLMAFQIYFRTSNLSTTAKQMGYSQSGHHNAKELMLRALQKLRGIPSVQRYVEFFEAALSNPLAWCDVQ